MADYVKQFIELVDQLKAYSQSTDPMFYTMRFIDGLRADIKAIVLVLRPKDLDIACTVALLQEEAGCVVQQRPHRPGDCSSTPRSPAVPRTMLPLPPPPARQDKPAAMPQVSSTSPDSKLAAIKSYRRALGLCFKCGIKWSRDHKCAPEVLHAVEVLWDSIVDDDCQSSLDVQHEPDEQLCLAMSKSASSGLPAARTIRFQAAIARLQVTVLIDSGSSTSFLSSAMAAKLTQYKASCQSSQVQVAGGGLLHSPAVLQSVDWSIDECRFRSDFRILDLSAFDAIIGMDWLTAFSPMHIDWRHQWIAIPYNGQYTILQGLGATVPDSVCLQLYSVAATAPSELETVQALALEVQQLVTSFASLFEQPTTLPPSRSCNRSSSGPIATLPA